MRESIGNSLLLNLVIIFSGIVILFFIGIITYSKAYRVKNRIIEIIEKYDGYTSCNLNDSDSKCAIKEINESLSESGYSLITKDCGKVQGHLDDVNVSLNAISDNKNSGDYNYCIYEVTDKSSDNSKYYIVATFVHFDFPVIGNWINIPVYGETKILGKAYNY